MSDPLWYKDAIIYQAHVRAFLDTNQDGIGDFRGLTEKLDYLEALGVNTLWLLPFYPSPLRRRRLRHRRLREHPSRLRHARRLRSLHRRGAPPQDSRHHRAGHQPHLGSASVVPGGAARAGRIARAQLLRLERDQPEVPGRADHLLGHREVELDVGRHRRRVLLAPLLPSPARSELRQPGRHRGGDAGDAVLARSRRRRHAARRRAVSDRARGHAVRQPRRDARGPQGDPPRHGRDARGSAAARRGESVAGRRAARTSATATNATWRSTSR